MSTKETAKDELNLTPEVKEMSEKLVKKLTIADDGSITPDKKLYEELLPEGLTPELLKKTQAFYANTLAAANHAVGTLGQDFLKKHKKVDEVRLDKLQLGTGASLRSSYKRSAEVSGIGGTKTTKYGWLTSKLSTTATGSGAAQFGRVRQHFAEQGAALFG